MGEHRARDRRQALHARRHLALVHTDPQVAPPARRLTRADLLSPEDYLLARNALRERVLAHKAPRRVPLGSAVVLLFEDRLTVLWQVQEAIRIERMFEPNAIDDELDAYNPLVPDGGNLKATMLVEAADAAGLGGVEHRVFCRVHGFDPVFARADAPAGLPDGQADLHFLRFEIPPRQRLALRAGAALALGIDDPRRRLSLTVPEATRLSLLADLA